MSATKPNKAWSRLNPTYKGKDRLYGGRGRDALRGGAGDDWLFGGRDRDRALYAGPASDYALKTTFGRTKVTDINPDDGLDEGSDLLWGVDKILYNRPPATGADPAPSAPETPLFNETRESLRSTRGSWMKRMMQKVF